jgi:hypothetical protein
MGKIADYQVISTQGTIELVKQVKLAINDGWELIGGVSISAASSSEGKGVIIYAQALIKYKTS